jgi:DNA invertase Pin-like site-specific DNA recombinase
MIAAIYARKSNDQSALHDEAKSVTRQIDHATEYAEPKGWRVGEDLVFSDDNIGGAEFGTRPGFLRLMNSLKPKPTFQVLVMSEESRLGRESIETAYAIKQLVQAGVRLFFYLEDRERTLDSPTDKLLLSVATFADELEREKARQRTYDAMLRKAKVGHVTGGRVFGYSNVDVMRPGPDGEPRRSHVERHINPKEAEIVRQILQSCADGCGKTRIAKLLNVEGAIAPRAQQGRPRAWSPSTVHEALYRPLYRGQVIWNQTRKRDKWGRKRMQRRPESEWLVVSAPQLQIVSDELWEAAHARLAHARGKYLRSTDGRLWGRPQDRESKYLLSGFARCGECGGSVSVRTHAHGKRRAPYYACLAYHQRGARVCRNRVEMPMTAVDDAVLDSLSEDILQPDIVEAAINRAIERLAPGARAEEAARIRTELAEVQRTIDNLTTAVGASGGLPSLLASLKAEEQRKVDLEAQLATAEHMATAIHVNAIRAKLEARLADWRTLLRQQVSQTRQMLRKLLDGPVTLTPLPDGQGCSSGGSCDV